MTKTPLLIIHCKKDSPMVTRRHFNLPGITNRYSEQGNPGKIVRQRRKTSNGLIKIILFKKKKENNIIIKGRSAE